MLTPVGEHDLLLFWVGLAVLLVAARGLGALASRFGQPAVIGELAAGLALGPSVLGKVAPDAARWLFPGGEVASALLLAVSWLGIVLLLTVTGFETDLRLLRRLGKPSAIVSFGSLLVPLVVGFAIGAVLPATLIGEQGDRWTFAAFLAVALSISALPVVAKILSDMNLMRRNFGQITVAAGMVNDLVGWLLLGALAGLVHTGSFDASKLATTLAAVAVFCAAAFTVGQKAFDAAVRATRRREASTGPLTVVIVAVLIAGSVTHALHMEAVIGAFIVGIVAGRSRFVPVATRHTIERVTTAIFAPVFFATAGLYVDLGSLADVSTAISAAVIVAVAAVTKLAGSYISGRISRLSHMESLAVGVGLNARGAMEIVLATIGLNLGVLNESSYTAVVVMAMVTSMAAPPLLRPILRRLEASPEEAARLAKEELLAASIIASANNALLPARGGTNSLLAAQMLDVVLQPDAHVTVFTVHHPDGTKDDRRAANTRACADALTSHTVASRQLTSDDAAKAVLDESKLGYDLVAFGLSEGFAGSRKMTPGLQRMLAEITVPTLLVRAPVGERPDPAALTHITVPATGTVEGLAAEEIAYVLGSRVGAHVDAVHIAKRDQGGHLSDGQAHSQLHRARDLASRFGHVISGLARVSPVAYEELMVTAAERNSDLLVLGTQLRTVDGQPFLGEGTEYLLENAPQGVLVVVFPPQAGEEH